MQAVQLMFRVLFGLLPILIPLILLGVLWHWASELLSEVRTISKHLERIASTLHNRK